MSIQFRWKKKAAGPPVEPKNRLCMECLETAKDGYPATVALGKTKETRGKYHCVRCHEILMSRYARNHQSECYRNHP